MLYNRNCVINMLVMSTSIEVCVSAQWNCLKCISVFDSNSPQHMSFDIADFIM